MALDLAGYAISAGSACSSGKVRPSHVALAMGYGEEIARSAIRISLGWWNNEAEIDGLAARLAHIAGRRFMRCRTCSRRLDVKVSSEMSSLQEMKIAADGKNRPKTPIYLDYQATTPIDPRVVEAMMPYFTEKFGNPHSRNHAYGWEAEEAVEKARAQVASLIGADEQRDRLHLRRDRIEQPGDQGRRAFLQGQEEPHHHRGDRAQVRARLLPPPGAGRLRRHLSAGGAERPDRPRSSSRPRSRPDTCIVSVMAVNNEIGVIQPLAEIGKICRERKVLFPHRRGAGVRQDPARRRRDEHRPDVDLRPQDLRAEGHRRALCPAQAARAAGGADPRRRAGARHALGHPADAALRRPGRSLRDRAARDGRGGRAAEGLRDRFHKKIKEQLPEVYLNGDLDSRIPGNLNLCFAYVEGEGLMMGIKDLAVSSGSACTSASLEPSYVLRALGVEEELAHTSPAHRVRALHDRAAMSTMPSSTSSNRCSDCAR